MISNLPEEYIELSYQKIIYDNPNKAAILIKFENRSLWVPRSLIQEIFEETQEVIIPEWFAVKEGLV